MSDELNMVVGLQMPVSEKRETNFPFSLSSPPSTNARIALHRILTAESQLGECAYHEMPTIHGPLPCATTWREEKFDLD